MVRGDEVCRQNCPLNVPLCLFPSLRPGMDKEVLGILVSYKVKVNLVVSRGG